MAGDGTETGSHLRFVRRGMNSANPESDGSRIMTKRATIVVDLQKEYLATGNLPLVGLDAALANAIRIIEAARTKGELLVHVRHEEADADAPVFNSRSDGVNFIPAVAAKEGERVIVKNYPNSFRDTQLKQLLDKHGVTDLVVIGAMSHMCIDATSRAAADFGYPVTVVHDACATMNLEFEGSTVPAAQVHAAFMAALGSGYAEITTTDIFLS